MNVKYATICVALFLAGVAPSDERARSQTLSTKYKNANSEREKLLVCIDAIESEEIHYFGHVKSIDEIFGTDFASKLPAIENSPARATIYFGEKREPRYAAQGSWKGWRFRFEYDNGGTITYYYLTDIDKVGPSKK